MAPDSLYAIEAVMLIEEIFEIEIPTEHLGSSREFIDWLESHLSNRRPNEQAAAMLRRLAKSHNNPKLAEGSDLTWRREQIAAIIREILRQ